MLAALETFTACGQYLEPVMYTSLDCFPCSRLRLSGFAAWSFPLRRGDNTIHPVQGHGPRLLFVVLQMIAWALHHALTTLVELSQRHPAPKALLSPHQA